MLVSIRHLGRQEKLRALTSVAADLRDGVLAQGVEKSGLDAPHELKERILKESLKRLNIPTYKGDPFESYVGLDEDRQDRVFSYLLRSIAQEALRGRNRQAINDSLSRRGVLPLARSSVSAEPVRFQARCLRRSLSLETVRSAIQDAHAVEHMGSPSTTSHDSPAEDDKSGLVSLVASEIEEGGEQVALLSLVFRRSAQLQVLGAWRLFEDIAPDFRTLTPIDLMLSLLHRFGLLMEFDQIGESAPVRAELVTSIPIPPEAFMKPPKVFRHSGEEVIRGRDPLEGDYIFAEMSEDIDKVNECTFAYAFDSNEYDMYISNHGIKVAKGNTSLHHININWD